MLVRFLFAILLGMLIGIILCEGLMAGHALFLPDHALLASLADAQELSAGQALILSAYWTVGASASALMATGLAQSRLAGAVCALLWMIPIVLLLGLSQQPAFLLSLAFSIGTLAWLLSQRLIQLEPH